KALDDAYRVPVNVVVNEPVAVLQVLALGNAVGGEEQVEFALAGKFPGPFFRARRKGGENRGKVLALAGKRSLISTRAGDERRVDAERCLRPRGKLIVEVTGRVREC